MSQSEPTWAIVGEPIPEEFQTAAGVNAHLRLVADLRAVLAPILDGSVIYIGTRAICTICGDDADTPALPVHAPDCPVLRRDELLGRTNE